jgi:hypothetical protein
MVSPEGSAIKRAAGFQQAAVFFYGLGQAHVRTANGRRNGFG